MARDYLKVFMKKYFVMNGQRLDIPFQRQQGIPLIHENIKMEVGFQGRCNY